MHRSFAIVLALTATVCARTTTIQPTNGNITTEEGLAAEYTTLDSITDLKVTNNNASKNDTIKDFKISRKRRIGGRFTYEVDDDEFEDDFPYVVALYDAEDNYVCVGTILTPNLILSAAHCFEGDPVSYIRANSRDSYKGGKKHSAGKPIFYGKGHDIALLPLKTKISYARPVVLLSPEVPLKAKQEVAALGWGRTKNHNDWPQYLTYNDLVVYPDQECWDLYESQYWICTETETSYSCQGDSGGPLLYFGLQVGITSASKAEECGSGFPTRNVDVRKYWDWIQKYVDIEGAFERSAFGLWWRKYNKKKTG